MFSTHDDPNENVTPMQTINDTDYEPPVPPMATALASLVCLSEREMRLLAHVAMSRSEFEIAMLDRAPQDQINREIDAICRKLSVPRSELMALVE